MSSLSQFADRGEEQGHCKGCRWWQAERDGTVSDDAIIGLCMQPELTHFSVEVSGHCGCNRFEHAAVPAEDLAGVR